jgi:hypothetical protein
MRQAPDLRLATRAGRKCEPETVQFDDRGDHAQAQAQAFDVSTFVIAIVDFRVHLPRSFHATGCLQIEKHDMKIRHG